MKTTRYAGQPVNHVVAAGDPTTAESARQILEAGGNAFDASVAAAFTAMVAEPGLTSAGGGGHALAVPVWGEPILFDFFVDMPTRPVDASKLDFVSINVDFGGARQQFHIGRGAAGVPGNVAGLLRIQRRLGILPLSAVLSPAIVAAREGIILSESQAHLVKILSPILTHEAKGAQVFAPQGSLLRAGDRLTMPEFADFLDALSREGVDLVYRGEVARMILEWAKDGGLLTAQDLAGYRVRERRPLQTQFYGHDVLLNPPPAQSGVLIEFTLSLLDSVGGKEAASVSLAKLVTALDITNQLRHERIRDGLTEGIPFPFSRQAYFRDYLDRFMRMESGSPPDSDPFSRGATTHASVMDKWGNAASVTTTNGEGCGYVLPEAGFMLNNMLGEEDLNPHGFHRHPGGTRLPSMVAPTIVPKKGRPVLVTGSAGSNRIRSVIVQLLVNFICQCMSVEEATAAPRLHLEGSVLHVEPGIEEKNLDELRSRYTLHRWQQQNLFFGGANSATPQGGAGDSRRGGCSIVI